jgi:hypothetical protein
MCPFWHIVHDSVSGDVAVHWHLAHFAVVVEASPLAPISEFLETWIFHPPLLPLHVPDAEEARTLSTRSIRKFTGPTAVSASMTRKRVAVFILGAISQSVKSLLIDLIFFHFWFIQCRPSSPGAPLLVGGNGGMWYSFALSIHSSASFKKSFPAPGGNLI